MKLGLSTATFFGKAVTEDTFDLIRKFDIEVCEVFMTTFFEYTSDFGDLLVSHLGDLKVFSVHSLNLHFEPELINPIERTRLDAEKIFKQVLNNGKKLNAKSYTFHGPARLKSRKYTFDFDKLGSRIEELCGISNKYGIDLSYENVHWSYFSVPDFFEKLKAYSFNIKCTLDIKQAMQAGLSYEDYLPVMAGRLNNVHISDFDQNGKLCVAGKGIVDYYKLFSMLRDIGYDNNLMIELYSQNYENYYELGQSIEYLANILEKIH